MLYLWLRLCSSLNHLIHIWKDKKSELPQCPIVTGDPQCNSLNLTSDKTGHIIFPPLSVCGKQENNRRHTCLISLTKTFRWVFWRWKRVWKPLTTLITVTSNGNLFLKYKGNWKQMTQSPANIVWVPKWTHFSILTGAVTICLFGKAFMVIISNTVYDVIRVRCFQGGKPTRKSIQRLTHRTPVRCPAWGRAEKPAPWARR